MCGINNDITTRTRVQRNRGAGGCDNNEGDTNAGRPLNLFQGDTLGECRGSGLFPRRAGGCGGIEDLLARINENNKKNQLDSANAANGLFSGGKDFGTASGSSCDEGGGGGGQGMQQAMQGIQQVLGMVMNVVKAIMGIFGGL